TIPTQLLGVPSLETSTSMAADGSWVIDRLGENANCDRTTREAAEGDFAATATPSVRFAAGAPCGSLPNANEGRASASGPTAAITARERMSAIEDLGRPPGAA